jgi:hypothetical protein
MKTNELEVEINGNKVTIALTDEQIKQLQTQQKEWYDGRVFDEMYMPIGTVDGIAVVDISEYKGGKDMNGAGFEPQRIFDNKNQAICATEYINLFIEMYNFAQLRNGKNKVDWSNGTVMKYNIMCNSNILGVFSYSTLNCGVFNIAFIKKEHAEEAIEIFGDRIKAVYSKLQNY